VKGVVDLDAEGEGAWLTVGDENIGAEHSVRGEVVDACRPGRAVFEAIPNLALPGVAGNGRGGIEEARAIPRPVVANDLHAPFAERTDVAA
jgi:hypothetical protein